MNTEFKSRLSFRKEVDKTSPLSGYLLKYYGRAGGGQWRKRWLTYNARSGNLDVYRHHEDKTCIESISIERASFVQVENSLNKSFSIHCTNSIHTLEAPSPKVALHWIQELQTKRREVCARTSSSSFGAEHIMLLSSNEGLLGSESELKLKETEAPPAVALVNPREAPDLMQLSPVGAGPPTKFGLLKNEFFHRVKNRLLVTDRPDAPPTPQTQTSVFYCPEYSPGTLKFPGEQSFPVPCVEQRRWSCTGCQEMSTVVEMLRESVRVAERQVLDQKQAVIKMTVAIKKMSEQPWMKLSEKQVQDLAPKISESVQCLLIQLSERISECISENVELRCQLQDNQEKVSMFTELLVSKDAMIVQLSNQIDSLQSGLGKPALQLKKESESREDNGLEKPDDSVVNLLKDTCEAYQMQNLVLNTEILELSNLRKKDLDRIGQLEEKLSNMEAEHIKVKSKYLVLLNDLSSPKQGEHSKSSTLIQALIEDACRVDSPASHSAQDEQAVDRYGFFLVNQNPSEPSNISLMSTKIVCVSENLERSETSYASLAVRWENYLVNLGGREFTKTMELKQLAREGIPHELRPRIWRGLVSMYTKESRELAGPEYYTSLVDMSDRMFNPSAKQIEIDLLRTFPTNKFFSTKEAPGILKLRRILLAYSWRNPDIGYCQGLNRITATMLFYLSEEDAFWCLVAFVEVLMGHDYYSRTLLASQVDQLVLKELFEEKLPRLHNHFKVVGIDISMVTFQWFLVIFVDNFAIETVFRIWDVFLCEGSKVLFRYSLAVLRMFEEDLLRQVDSLQTYDFLRNLAPLCIDHSRLSRIAFTQLDPFPMKFINLKRSHHAAAVKQQLEDLARLRSSRTNEQLCV